jgi:ppGpp synthetase/RelA/SpoT-type nucleotidyltranferase
MSDEVDVLARHLVAMAELDDGVLTDSLQLLVSRTEGALVGLDHRIKTVDSLRRKLADMLALDPDLQLADAAERVHDVLRYTVVADLDAYMAVYEPLLAELRRQGATVLEVRNRWAGPGYRGINVHLRAGVNQRFEIQFRTRDSYAAAKATRGQYEELRLATISPERAADLVAAIEAAFAAVPVPPGAVPW